MNNDVLKGKWNQIKGDVKRSFGKLTDDDMMVLEGDSNKASGLLQERYGYTREEAEKKWSEFTNRWGNTGENLKNDVKAAVNDVRNDLRNDAKKNI